MPTLNWIGKEAVVNHHLTVPFRLLKDVPELSCGDPGSGNLIVEGDNLVALKALLPYYAGQVKCIYIDPPYNTGNEGWAYNDNVNSPLIREWIGKAVGKEGETLDRHDRWLCMMYPRLALLKEFLREDGAIFVSIDDNEVASLRFIMDEIFGRENFVTDIIWHKVFASKASAQHFSESHDHILVYARSASTWTRHLIPRSAEQVSDYKNPDNDPRGPWRSVSLSARNPYNDGKWSTTTPGGRVIDGPPAGRYWAISKPTFEALCHDDRVWWGANKNGVPRRKLFLSEVQQGIVPTTIWNFKEVGSTQDSKKELVSLVDFKSAGDVFLTPKPSSLIQRILQIASDKDSLILDSFAGSGTTGHAVLKQNEADGGNRRFILVELETSVSRKITRERIRRVAEGHTLPKGNLVPGLGGGFRYCQLGDPLFDETGEIRKSVSFTDLARHVWFTETGEPLPRERVKRNPLLGDFRGAGIYLLYNGILADKSLDGGNVLTRSILADLPPFDGPRVIYCAGCRIGTERLRREGITIRQTPYEIKVS